MAESYDSSGNERDSADQIAKPRLTGDQGEGVVSTGIAVLIMAFLGALMWIGFRRIWETTERNTETKVEQIGGS